MYKTPMPPHTFPLKSMVHNLYCVSIILHLCYPYTFVLFVASSVLISTVCLSVYVISMGQCKKDITPLLTHWSNVFLALTHRYWIAWKKTGYVSTSHIAYCKISNRRCTKPQNFNVSRLGMQLSLRNILKPGVKVENEDVVGAAPTGDAPTTSEWSTI